jgi:hypothetical protein
MSAMGFALAVAATSAAPELNAQFTAFAGAGDKERAAQVIEAAKASPALLQRLNQLAKSGKLKGFSIGNPAPFGAGHKDGMIILSGTFVDQQTPKTGDSDLARANLVFILGYMASKLDHDAEVEATVAKQMDAFKARASATPKGGSVDVTSDLLVVQRAKLEEEAVAQLQGWSDEVDAATQAKGANLSVPEAFKLLSTSRNTPILLKAATLGPDARIAPASTFQFPASEHNVAAVLSVLGASQMLDFQ